MDRTELIRTVPRPASSLSPLLPLLFTSWSILARQKGATPVGREE